MCRYICVFHTESVSVSARVRAHEKERYKEK